MFFRSYGSRRVDLVFLAWNSDRESASAGVVSRRLGPFDFGFGVGLMLSLTSLSLKLRSKSQFRQTNPHHGNGATSSKTRISQPLAVRCRGLPSFRDSSSFMFMLLWIKQVPRLRFWICRSSNEMFQFIPVKSRSCEFNRSFSKVAQSVIISIAWETSEEMPFEGTPKPIGWNLIRKYLETLHYENSSIIK